MPKTIVSDSGTEMTITVILGWRQGRYGMAITSPARKPMTNGFAESFNGSFRDECLKETLFWLLSSHAQQ